MLDDMTSSPRLAGLTLRDRWRRTRLRACSGTLTSIYHAASLRPALWRVMARSYHPAFDRIAARHALLSCRLGSVAIPAYRDLLLRSGLLLENGQVKARGLVDFPETSKQNYAGCYDEASRCPDGRMYRPGVIVDESSGSTGRPYNWVRGPQELKAIYRSVAGYVSLAFPGEKLFVINAYSMGAWATGTTTGNALSRIAMVKNTGPDLEKIIDTLVHFGPGYDYIVTAYPPFLKHLRDRLDAAGFDWERYRLRGMVGGEGMTEALRDYLEERFEQVRSGYGASDLTIGIAAETNFTVWLRKQLAADRELRRELLGPAEQRLPMIFHYNPLET
jgi:phenylacetate-CoA ligase